MSFPGGLNAAAIILPLRVLLRLFTAVRYANSWCYRHRWQSYTERERKMMQETGVHVKPFVETSTPPFPPLGWISDRGEVARRIPQLPRDTLYDYLSGKSVQPGTETFEKRLCSGCQEEFRAFISTTTIYTCSLLNQRLHHQ